jgi:hypothetical protein
MGELRVLLTLLILGDEMRRSETVTTTTTSVVVLFVVITPVKIPLVHAVVTAAGVMAAAALSLRSSIGVVISTLFGGGVD